MKLKRNIKNISLTLVAVALLIGLTVDTAMAYFTTYAIAKGGVEVDLGFTKTEINENVVAGKKEITIENTGEYDCFVRIKALVGDAYIKSIRYSEPDNAGKWTPGPDGYYYYSDIVSAHGSTTQIDVSFSFPEVKPTDFNVIIIQEWTPVFYKQDGTPYADWSVEANTGNPVE